MVELDEYARRQLALKASKAAREASKELAKGMLKLFHYLNRTYPQPGRRSTRTLTGKSPE